MTDVYLFELNTSIWPTLKAKWDSDELTSGFSLTPWSSKYRVIAPDAPSSYTSALSFVRDDLSETAVLLVHLGLIDPGIDEPAIQPRLAKFCSEARVHLAPQLSDYLAPSAPAWSGLALIGEALLNSNWRGLIFAVTSRGSVEAARLAFEGWKKHCQLNGAILNKDVEIVWNPVSFHFAEMSERLLPHVGLALTEYKLRFGHPIKSMRKRLATLQSPNELHDAIADLRGNRTPIDPAIVEAIKAMLGFRDDPFVALLGEHSTSPAIARLRDIMAGVIAGMGVGLPGRLTTGAAWLVALSAFRSTWPSVSWTNRFSVKELLACRSFAAISPSQSPAMLRETADSLFDLFQLFFKREYEPECAVTAVTLTERGTLLVDLGWDFAKRRDSRSTSLYENLQVWCKKSTDGEGLFERNENGELKEQHRASLALWRFWLTSSWTDQSDQTDKGAFHCGCRMNLIRTQTGPKRASRLEFRSVCPEE